MRTAFLLGAGFSKWAANVPVASELFDFRISTSARDRPKLSLVRGLKHDWDSANPGAYAEEFIAHILEKGLQAHRNALKWYIARRLNEPFLWEWERAYDAPTPWRRRTLGIDEVSKRRLRGVSIAETFLANEMEDTCVGLVTTNYDLLIEYALGSGGFHYGVEGERLHGRATSRRRGVSVELTGRIPLAKLHGSVSWELGRRYSDGRRALGGDPLIVAPVPEKSPLSALHPVWRLASEILNSATRIVVFGFAFNPYDVAVLELLSQAHSVENVDVFDISPPIERAKAIWPSAAIEAYPPPIVYAIDGTVIAGAT